LYREGILARQRVAGGSLYVNKAKSGKGKGKVQKEEIIPFSKMTRFGEYVKGFQIRNHFLKDASNWTTGHRHQPLKKYLGSVSARL
jgi:hypothetical protein